MTTKQERALTDERIEKLADEFSRYNGRCWVTDFTGFTRAIEAECAALQQQAAPVAWLILGPLSRLLTEDPTHLDEHRRAGFEVTPLYALEAEIRAVQPAGEPFDHAHPDSWRYEAKADAEAVQRPAGMVRIDEHGMSVTTVGTYERERFPGNWQPFYLRAPRGAEPVALVERIKRDADTMTRRAVAVALSERGCEEAATDFESAVELLAAIASQAPAQGAEPEPEAVVAARQARDDDWVVAMGLALGMDSHQLVPIVPTVEGFRRLFSELRASQASEKPAPVVPEPPVAALDWNRLRGGMYLALDPKNQWAFDRLNPPDFAAQGKESS